MRFRSFHWLVFFLIFASVPALARAQGSIQIEQQVNALRRLFPEIGGGVRAVKSGPNGELLVLLPQKILLYDAKGAKIREMPAAPASRKTPPALMYGEAFDVDAAGKVYVADRGAGMLRIFSVTGDLESSVPVESPTGVVLLPSGEVAVASVSPTSLLTVFDMQGKVQRQFGDSLDLADTPALNLFLNSGRLATDAAGNLYYAFTFAPEPTFRKYDRFGYAAYENSLKTLDFLGAAEAARKRIARRDNGDTVDLLQDVTAIGVDPQAQTACIAVGDLLLLFDKDGNLRSQFRLYTPEDARLEINSILVLPDKLIVSSDTLGIYEFARLDGAAKPQKAAN
ncbi:MAG TPA: hypothetical protein VN862_11305 [Candidatus Acidoferrales bacterium]|jgi:hypothetical protein|nr:hypothetical protein [Candidatus Acidoferrales bacterium]